MRTLLLIIFKILEIAGLVAVYLGMCRIGWLIDVSTTNPLDWNWYNPLYFTLSLGIICITLFFILILIWIIFEGIPKWIEYNEDLIDKMLKK